MSVDRQCKKGEKGKRGRGGYRLEIVFVLEIAIAVFTVGLWRRRVTDLLVVVLGVLVLVERMLVVEGTITDGTFEIIHYEQMKKQMGSEEMVSRR